MKKKKLQKINYLDYACKIGEKVQWNSINGEHYEGIILEWLDNEIARIKLDDNSEIEVQC